MISRVGQVLSMLAAIVIAVTAGGPARAADNFRSELQVLAKDIKKLLDGRHETAIAVGQFVAPPHLASSAGPAISAGLTDELKRLGVAVNRRAELIVEGRFADADLNGLTAVALNVKIVDRGGEEIVGLKLKPRGIVGDTAVASLLGLTVQLPANGRHDERDRRLRAGIDKPRVNVDKAVIRAPGSPYAIQVLVKSSGKYVPREARNEDGLAFVKISRDEVYGVAITNEADHEVAVTLTIDGLNLFAFSDVKNKTGRPLYSCFLVPAKSTYVVKGWHRTNEVSNEFVVTEYAKSAAAELNSTANIGTITATFAAAWSAKGKPPADEPRSYAFVRGSDATGRGAAIPEKFDETQRQVGVVRAAVSVRYTR